MKRYIIVFDLIKPDKTESEILSFIHVKDNYIKIRENTYYFESNANSDTIGANLRPLICKGDKIMIIEVTPCAWSYCVGNSELGKKLQYVK